MKPVIQTGWAVEEVASDGIEALGLFFCLSPLCLHTGCFPPPGGGAPNHGCHDMVFPTSEPMQHA